MFFYNETAGGFCWLSPDKAEMASSSLWKMSEPNFSNQITAAKLNTSMKMPKAKYPRSRAGLAFKNILDVGSCHDDSDHAA